MSQPPPTPPRRRRATSAALGARAASALVALVVALLAALGAATGTAHAQNEVVNSSPATGSQLDQAPDEIVIGFADDLGDGNSIALSCEGDPVELAAPEVLEDGRTLQVPIEQALPSGTCTARWSVAGVDGAPEARGVITFVIANAPVGAVDTSVTTEGAAAGTVPAPSGSGTAVATSDPAVADGGAAVGGDPEPEVVDMSIAGRGDAALWLARLLSTIGIAVLFGSLLVVTAAWPEGVEYLVTVRFLRSVWVFAIVTTVVFTALAAAAVTPDGGGSALSPGTWLDLLSAGWAGRAVLVRVVLLAASAWVAFRPDRAIDPTTQLAALGIPGLCVATLGLSRTVGDLVPLGVLMGVLHALAMAIWVGGAVLVARIVLSGPGEEDLVHAVRGFARVSTPAIVVTIVTGVVQMIRLDGGALFQSGHGRVVVLKSVVVAAMIVVALSARQFVNQRLNRAQQMTVPLADRLRRAFGAEAAIGLLVLALSAWLLAFQPPNVDAGSAVDYQVRQTHRVEAADLDVVVELTDDQVGLVGLQVTVSSPEEGLSDLAVVFTAPPNGLDLLGYRQPVPLRGVGTAVRDEAIGLPISVPGEWTVQVQATTAAAGTVTSDPQTYVVRDVDGSVDTAASAATTAAPTPTAQLVTIPPGTDP